MSAQAVAERALTFGCEGEALVGILHAPSAPCDAGVVVIVGGPQYRAGSHRQFVLLARVLAAAGFPVLRFDYRGMGDSTGAQRSFETVVADVGAAIDELQRQVPAVRRIVLWGLCDGASAALLYCDATRDTRIAGMCALNPWIRSDASLAKTQLKHYYAQRLLSPAFWGKLLRGRVAMDAVPELMRKVRTATAANDDPLLPAGARGTFQQRMARAWQALNGPVLLMLSGKDYTAKEFLERSRTDPAWASALRRARLQWHDLADADHTLSDPVSRRSAEDFLLDWLVSGFAPTATLARRGR